MATQASKPRAGVLKTKGMTAKQKMQRIKRSNARIVKTPLKKPVRKAKRVNKK